MRTAATRGVSRPVGIPGDTRDPCPIRFACLLALAIYSVLAPAHHAPRGGVTPSAAPHAPPASFAGTWESTFGPITFRQTGAAVHGEYEMDDQPATIDGTLADRGLTFTYKEHNAAGEGWFELAADGKAFEGKWRQKGSEEWSDWTGKLAVPPGFDGLWQTTFGPMRLHVNEALCEGIYDWNGIQTIKGGLEGTRFTFKYQQTDESTAKAGSSSPRRPCPSRVNGNPPR